MKSFLFWLHSKEDGKSEKQGELQSTMLHSPCVEDENGAYHLVRVLLETRKSLLVAELSNLNDKTCIII